jgi:hypothetical protein
MVTIGLTTCLNFLRAVTNVYLADREKSWQNYSFKILLNMLYAKFRNSIYHLSPNIPSFLACVFSLYTPHAFVVSGMLFEFNWGLNPFLRDTHF